MKLNETSFRIGGLLRCCIQSFEEWEAKQPADVEVADGASVKCRWCKDGQVVLSNGSWM